MARGNEKRRQPHTKDDSSSQGDCAQGLRELVGDNQLTEILHDLERGLEELRDLHGTMWSSLDTPLFDRSASFLHTTATHLELEAGRGIQVLSKMLVQVGRIRELAWVTWQVEVARGEVSIDGDDMDEDIARHDGPMSVLRGNMAR